MTTQMKLRKAITAEMLIVMLAIVPAVTTVSARQNNINAVYKALSRYYASGNYAAAQAEAAVLAKAGESVRGTIHIILRVCGYETKESADLVCLNNTRPLAVFAGLWTTWTRTRGTKANPVEGEHELFGFLTTEPNDVVAAIHPKAMPVISTTKAEIERWMTAPAEEALKLQRPLEDGKLKIVAKGERKDGMA